MGIAVELAFSILIVSYWIMVNVQVEKRVDVSARQQTALVVVAARLQTPPGMWIVIWIQDFVS